MLSVIECKEAVARPGKFQGESSYVPYFWDLSLECGQDDILWDDSSDSPIYIFDISSEDIEIFPALKGQKKIGLMESEDGFVYEIDLDMI